jgi:hypothetical protein
MDYGKLYTEGSLARYGISLGTLGMNEVAPDEVALAPKDHGAEFKCSHDSLAWLRCHSIAL